MKRDEELREQIVETTKMGVACRRRAEQAEADLYQMGRDRDAYQQIATSWEAQCMRAEEDLAACRDLLAEAVGWIGDPSAYFGTRQADDFCARTEAELAKRSTSAQPKG